MSRVQSLPIFEQSHKSNASVNIVDLLNDGDEVHMEHIQAEPNVLDQTKPDQSSRLDDEVLPSKTLSRVDSPLQGPSGLTVLPKRVLSTLGTVEVVSPSTFTLTNEGQYQAEIIIDYSRAEGGDPIFSISSATSSDNDVKFQVTYSETLKEISHATGDGPFFLFSNAMDSYRSVTHTIKAEPQTIRARHAQRSQRYQKINLLTPHSRLEFASLGFRPVLNQASSNATRGTFTCSSPLLNKIYSQGVRTLEMCTVAANETEPAWDVTAEGTRVYGQHWAPCRQGTRWTDIVARFDVKIEAGGASWAIHMVANGLIFCLNREKKTLEAFEGLSNEGSVFPSTPRGKWTVGERTSLVDGSWLKVEVSAIKDAVSVVIDDDLVGVVRNLDLHPLLGGASNNSGSVAFGGPEGWVSMYRDLIVTSIAGEELYRNTLGLKDAARTFEDFAVGTNPLACTIDGAKRDRSAFGGDLHISGRSIAYSTANFEAIRGTIKLLTSHQTKDGYLGNLCPIQAPVHTGGEEPPTYAFYSVTYALLLVVAIKDYWLNSGDLDTISDVWPALIRLKAHIETMVNEHGLVSAPPPLSLTFFPLVGPVFGVSTQINLAYYAALLSMATMSKSVEETATLRARAGDVKASIVKHLYDQESGVLRLGEHETAAGIAQDVHSYGVALGVVPVHANELRNLTASDRTLPPTFAGLGPRFDSLQLCSPYSTSFAVEACFTRGHATAGIDLIQRVWGVMADESNPNFSGCHWEAMTLEGEPYHNSTSLVHAWSTGPVHLLPRYTAGLRATEPGWKKWEARPLYAGLDQVQASVPTPAGSVEIEWHFNEKTGRGSVSCTAPTGTLGTVYPPPGWAIQSRDGDSLHVEQGIEVVNGQLARSLKMK